MHMQLFALTMLMALLGPLVALAYLKPILLKVLRSLCDAEGSAEFWVRSAYLLAVCGTVLLMLLFGDVSASAQPVEVLRRSLLLVFGGVFVSIALIARNVWRQVLGLLQNPAAAPLADPAPQTHPFAHWSDTPDAPAVAAATLAVAPAAPTAANTPTATHPSPAA